MFVWVLARDHRSFAGVDALLEGSVLGTGLPASQRQVRYNQRLLTRLVRHPSLDSRMLSASILSCARGLDLI